MQKGPPPLPTPRPPSRPPPPPTTSVADRPAVDAPFVSSARFERIYPNALAIYCSDGRFTDAIEELLRHLGHARLDTLTMPGGPALLNFLAAGFADLDAMKRAASLLVQSHSTTRAVLVAHAGCAYYQARHASRSAAEIEALQQNDLRIAKRALTGGQSTLAVDLYFARPQKDRVVFEPVTDA